MSEEQEKLKLEVPFYEQETNKDCGPTALKMVLMYFGEHHTCREISKLMSRSEDEPSLSMGIALSAKKLCFPAEFSSSNPNTVKGNNPYFQEKLNKLNKEAEKLGIIPEKKETPLDELLQHVKNSIPPIVCLDWPKIDGKCEGDLGHFVPIVGFNEELIYVHNSGLENPEPYYQISKKDFLEAWKKADYDVIIIKRKNKIKSKNH